MRGTIASAFLFLALTGGLASGDCTPSATVSGNKAICDGSTTTVQAILSGTPGWNVTWSDGFVQYVQTGPAVRTVSPHVTTKYSVSTVTNDCGTIGVGTGSATVTVTQIPATPVITAPSSVVPNQTVITASVPNHPPNSYSWSITNGTITSGADTSTITFNAGSSGVVGLFVVESAGGCPSQPGRLNVLIGGSLTLSLSPGSASVVVGSTTPFTVTLGASQPNAITVSLSSSAPANATVPASVVVAAGALSGSFNATGIAAGSSIVSATLPASLGAASAASTVTVFSSCAAPAAPALSSASASITAGQSLAIRWSTLRSLSPGGTYVVETSRNAFASIDATLFSLRPEVLLPTGVSPTGFTISIRVRELANCGTPGTNSNILSFPVSATPAAFVISKTPGPLVATKGSASPGAIIELKNVGGTSGRVTLSIPGAFLLDRSFADVSPGDRASFTISATPAAVSSDFGVTGVLRADFPGGSLFSPLSLTITSSLDSSGAKVRSSINALTFSAPAGTTPTSQAFDLVVSFSGQSTPVFLTPIVGPGGSWLTLSSDLLFPVAASGQVRLTVGVDRSKRSTDEGSAPLRTLLRITPVGGDPITDSAVIEVFDIEPVPVQSGTDRGAATGAQPLAVTPPGGRSFILPTTVRATGLGGQQVFTSDGWLRNPSSTPIAADVYFTPDGKNGLSDTGVRKAAVSVGAGSTYRLSDLVANVFALGGTSGEVEVRSGSPGALTLRSTVESITSGDPASRYGTEIPAVSFGSGIELGRGVLAVPGIDDDATNRANLVLAETTGSPASVRVAVNDANGLEIGAISRDLPPYGKIQIDRIVNAVSPGKTLSGGWAGVTVTSGSGKVVAVATVIDNRSGSFSAILGKGAKSPSTGSAGSGAGPLLATLPNRLIVPSLARTLGAFNTQFTTSLSIANPTGTPAILTLTYEYVDQDDSNTVKSSQRTVTIPARGAMSKSVGSDIIANLFGVTNRSFGSILVEGDVVKVAAVGGVSAQVDPNDASKGLKTAQINALYLDASEVMGLNEQERRFAGIEKSVQRRTNVILREVAGLSCRVLLRLYSTTGAKMGESAFDVGPNQYRQINDIFADAGMNLGDGPFQNVEITAQVVSGAGRVVAVATVNDNISKNPEIFLFGLPGPTDSGPSIGF